MRLRLPWIGLGLLGACLAAWVIGSYQGLIARYAVIVAFMHIVGATGGDAGRQTLTVVTASMATGELDLWRPWKVVGRQSLLGLLHGVASGLVLLVIALVVEQDVRLAATVCLAQIANQTVASLVASSLPLLLRRLGQDPTLGTPTVVIALADIVGFATFLGLASLLLPSAVG